MAVAPETLEVYRMCREESRHEFEILSGRMNTFMISQSCLVSAYAVAMNNTNLEWGHIFKTVFPSLVCLTGFVLAMSARPGILGAVEMIRHWHARQDTLLAQDKGLQLYYAFDPQVQTRIHRRDIWFPQAATVIFGTAWIAFGTLALWFCLIGHS
jgi:hypothetical protein